LAERHRINEEIERQKRTADSLDRPETTDTLRLIPKKMDTKIYADEKHERVIATVDPVSYTHLDVYKRQVLHYKKS
ncbi:hypothetical protein, partial [Treponema sp. R8-4-B8]